MSNFWQRAITGILFVVVLIGAIILGGWYMHITFGLVVLLGLLEFYKLFGQSGTQPQKWVGTLTWTFAYFLSLLAVYYGSVFGLGVLFLGMLGIFVFGIIELFRVKDKPFENIAITLIGGLYIAMPFIFLNLMNLNVRGYTQWYTPWPALSVFILIWSNDTFAYLTGRLIGRHKLFERISPKKTWEGFIGGVVFAIIAGVTLAYFLEQSYIKYTCYALVAGVIGTLGDLVESMLKRSVNVKDSGNILPGHGGILDRFDAVLFVAPVIFFLEAFIFR